LGKKWEYNETVHQLFLDFKEAYDSVRRELLYSIPIECRETMKLVRQIKMCLNETYSKVCIGKHLSDLLPIQNVLKHGDAISPLLFNFSSEYSIRKVQEDTIKKNTENLIDASNEVGIEVNRENKVCVDVSSPECRGKS
jgi:hypothetical protein